jgi:peptidoglycan/xylan/chitin deacetylase (PgdA/CDA1 family)
VLKELTGKTPRLFRPPYLDSNDELREVEASFGLTEINADVDSVDWDNVSTEAIVEKARTLQAGQVMLMHDWPPNTVAAIGQIATDLRDRGLCAGMISPETGRAVAPDRAPHHHPRPGTPATPALPPAPPLSAN